MSNLCTKACEVFKKSHWINASATLAISRFCHKYNLICIKTAK